jgi:hypothetical protein
MGTLTTKGREWLAGQVAPSVPSASALAVVQPRRISRAVPRKRHMRRSLVQALLCCPMYRPGNSEEAAFGSALHDAIATYLNACVAHSQESLLDREVVREIGRAAFFRTARGIDPGRWPEFLDLFDEWCHGHGPDLTTLYGVEVFFEVEEDVAHLNGTMDLVRRLDDGDPLEPPTVIGVEDHKSQWAVEGHLFQMRFYAGLVCRTWETVTEVHTTADHFRRKYGIVSVVYSRAECLEWWEDMLYGLRRYMAAPKRVAVGGAQCQRCDRRRTCGKALDPWRTMPADDAEAAVLYGEWKRLQEAAKIDKGALRAYTKAREPLLISGQDVGWMTSLVPRAVFPNAEAVRDHLNTPRTRRGDEVTKLIVDRDVLNQDELDELVLAGLARMDPGTVSFKERKHREPGDELDAPPDPSGLTPTDREE